METTQINCSLFWALESMMDSVEPAIAFQVIQRMTNKSADDLVAELAHHTRQAKNGLNQEAYEWFKAVFEEAMAG